MVNFLPFRHVDMIVYHKPKKNKWKGALEKMNCKLNKMTW